MREEHRSGPRRAAALVEAFARLADTLVADYDVIDVLEGLSGECVTLFAIDAAGLLLDDPRGGLRVVACSSEQAQLVELFELQTDEGPCRDCVRAGTPVTARDLADDDAGVRWPHFAPHALEAGVHAVHALPMRLRNRTIGALNLFTTEPGDLPAPDLRAAQAMADVATISVLSERDRRTPESVREQLRVALDSRVVVEQATGVLAERGGLDMPHAFARLRDYARRSGLRLTEVARGIVAGRLDTAPLLAADD